MAKNTTAEKDESALLMEENKNLTARLAEAEEDKKHLAGKLKTALDENEALFQDCQKLIEKVEEMRIQAEASKVPPAETNIQSGRDGTEKIAAPNSSLAGRKG